MAIHDREIAEKLHRKSMISDAEVQTYRGKVDLTLATLRGMNDDLAEEFDRVKLEIRKKKAEVDQANGQRESALTLVSRNQRLNERQPGMVAAEDVAKAEAELRSAEAHVQVKQVELEEAQLQYKQCERKRSRITEILESFHPTESESTSTSSGTR